MSLSFEDAAAKVTPALSSINCAYISLLLLKTLKRGLVEVPETFFANTVLYFLFCTYFITVHVNRI
jgi:hypothetical protein